MPAKSSFTPEQDAKGKEMAAAGAIPAAIAEALGKKVTSVYSRAKQTWKIGLTRSRGVVSREAVVEAAKAAVGKGEAVSSATIAATLGISEVTARRKCPGFFGQFHYWKEEDVVNLRSLAAEGQTAAQIAERLGTSARSVLQKARLLKISIVSDRKSIHGTRAGALKAWSAPGRKEAQAEKMRALWENPEWKKATRVKIQASRMRPDVIEKLRAVARKGSSIETVVNKILTDLKLVEGKDYDRHFHVGFYEFDFRISRPGKQDLLIECNGNYWHSLERTVRTDASKQEYIHRYHADKYDLKTLWEHQFLAEGKVAATIGYWLGTVEVQPVALDSLSVRPVTLKAARDFFGAYHYLGGIGRWGVCYGAFLGEELVAAAVFGHPVRQSTAKQWGLNSPEIRELTRLAIRPDRQAKNLGSWFLSRASALLFKDLPEVKLLVSFADETYGHTGAVYKASNWTEDGVVPPNYWYSDANGFVTGKQALYKHARRCGKKEAEFAAEQNLQKIYGFKKHRFILRRSA